MVTRNWLGLCAVLYSAAVVGQPPQTPAPGTPPASVPPSSTPRNPPPADDEFIEFLGADDVGDAAWWEFLKNSAPGKDPPKPAVPPQDARS